MTNDQVFAEIRSIMNDENKHDTWPRLCYFMENQYLDQDLAVNVLVPYILDHLRGRDHEKRISYKNLSLEKGEHGEIYIKANPVWYISNSLTIKSPDHHEEPERRGSHEFFNTILLGSSVISNVKHYTFVYGKKELPASDMTSPLPVESASLRYFMPRDQSNVKLYSFTFVSGFGHTSEWFQDNLLEHIISSKSVIGLKKLSFCFVPIFGDRILKRLSNSHLANTVESLSLNRCDVTTDGFYNLFDNHKRWSKLNSLSLGSSSLNFVNFRGLRKSKLMRRITDLSLGNCGLSSRSVEELSLLGSACNLKRLSLFNNRLGDEAFDYFARSPYINKLEEIDIRNTDITVDGIKAFVNSPNASSIKSIITNYRLSDLIYTYSTAKNLSDEFKKQKLEQHKSSILTKRSEDQSSSG